MSTSGPFSGDPTPPNGGPPDEPAGLGIQPTAYPAYPGSPAGLDGQPGGYPAMPSDPPPGDPLVTTDVGGFLGAVFRAWWRNKTQVSALSLLPVVLGIGLTGAFAAPMFRAASADPHSAVLQGPFAPYVLLAHDPAMLVTAILLMILLLVAGPLQLASVFHSTLRRSAGRPAPVGESLRFGGQRLLPLIGWLLALVVPVWVIVGLLAGLVYVTGVAALGILVFLAELVLGFGAGTVALSALIGVVLVEQAGVPRAWALTRARFGAALGRIVLFSVVLGVAGMVIALAAGLLGGVAAVAAGPGALIVVMTVVLAVMFLLMLGLQAVYPLVAYVWLRNQENRAAGAVSLAAELG